MDILDQADWLSFRNGDRRAFARMYLRHKDHLLTYCVCTGLSREAGEDILQDAFATLAQQTGAITSIRSWLFICVRNACINCLKAKKREAEIPSDFATEDALPSESRALIEQVLSQLEPEQQELILLRELHGLAIRELAEVLQVSQEAVRVRLYRVRKRMYELGKVLL